VFVLHLVLDDNDFSYHKYVHLFQEGIECFSIGFIVIICWSILTAISTLNSWLISLLDSPAFTMTLSQWEKFQSCFSKLLQLIWVADNILSFCIGCGLLSFLIQATLVSSLFIKFVNSGFSDLLNMVLWTIYVAFAMFQLFWKAAEINEEIQRSLQHLGNARFAGLPVSLQNELIFFQNRLSSNTIGITVFRVHLINRGMVSSVASVYITYLIVLLQFNC